jgi:hypothetical protein
VHLSYVPVAPRDDHRTLIKTREREKNDKYKLIVEADGRP